MRARRCTRLLLLGIALGLAAKPVCAQEVKEIRVAKQFGLSYLPMIVMEERKLFEKHAQTAGLGTVTASWTQLSAGPPMNDALLSGNLDFASGGVGPLVTIWARTRENLNIKGVAAITSMPLYLNTINPAVKTLKDFTDKDRIALPAIKVSLQAVMLHMAADQQLGRHDALDHLTVSMSHPDGMIAMMSGKSEITAHFTSAPFMYQELQDPRLHRVVNSYDVLGGPATFTVLWATSRFRDQNPRTYKAFVSALREAMDIVNADKSAAAALWIKAENSKLDQAFVERIVKDPENVFTAAPQNIMKYATFMHKVGSIREKPSSWMDLFFPEIHDLPGS